MPASRFTKDTALPKLPITQPLAHIGATCGLSFMLVLPWLNPVATGPSPSVYPWIMSTACSAVLWLCRTQLTARLIASTWLLAAMASAGMGLLQYFGYAYFFSGWLHNTGLGEAFANLRQRNQFATLTSVGLLALLFLAAVQKKSSSETGQANVWWLFPSIALLALGNATSSSRTGMLQWCLILALTVLWATPRQRRLVWLSAGALTSYAMATLALPLVLEASTGSPSGGLLARFVEVPGCGSRRVLWTNVLHLIAEKPWTGWGWGELDYAHFVTPYSSERFCDILDNAHNLPLHLAVELGMPAAIVLCGAAVWWAWRNAPWAEVQPSRQMAWGVLAVIGLHSLLEYPLWYGPFQLAVGLSLLMLWRTFRAAAQSGDDANPEHPSALVLNTQLARIADCIAVGVCLALLAAAAWDYWRVGQLYLPANERSQAYRENTPNKVRGSWLFQDQVQFAELTTVPLERQNAAQRYAQSQKLLHFSPEPRVIEAAIESAVMLGRDAEALFYLQRYQAAFPDSYAAWSKKQGASQGTSDFNVEGVIP